MPITIFGSSRAKLLDSPGPLAMGFIFSFVITDAVNFDEAAHASESELR
jgi:hypothetical protein